MGNLARRFGADSTESASVVVFERLFEFKGLQKGADAGNQPTSVKNGKAYESFHRKCFRRDSTSNKCNSFFVSLCRLRLFVWLELMLETTY
jgi:hypothetical protein